MKLFTGFIGARWYRPKKLRVLLAWLGSIFIFYYSQSSETTFRIGVPLILMGEATRIWACGFMAAKGKILAVDGPFAFVRNPLYVGNFLIGLGVTVISNQIPIYIAFFLGFILVYARTITHEETALSAHFSAEYDQYKKKTPRFLPTLKGFTHKNGAPFQWGRLLKHREHLTFIGLISTISALYLWEKWVLENDFGWKQVISLGVLGLMAIALLVERKLCKLYEEKTSSSSSI